MTNVRLVIGLVAAAGSLLAVAACSSSTTGTGSSSGTTGDGGASSSSSGSSGTSSSSSGGPKQCAASTSTCTEAEQKPYTDCIQSKCDSTFKTCYGSNFQSGTYDGTCGTYLTCTQACACGDTACLSKCTLDDACKNCLFPAFQTCSGMCETPACYSAGSSGSSGTSGSSGSAAHTCADLQACCDAEADPNKKSACDMVLSQAAGSDATCSTYYTALSCTN